MTLQESQSKSEGQGQACGKTACPYESGSASTSSPSSCSSTCSRGRSCGPGALVGWGRSVPEAGSIGGDWKGREHCCHGDDLLHGPGQRGRHDQGNHHRRWGGSLPARAHRNDVRSSSSSPVRPPGFSCALSSVHRGVHWAQQFAQGTFLRHPSPACASCMANRRRPEHKPEAYELSQTEWENVGLDPEDLLEMSAEEATENEQEVEPFEDGEEAGAESTHPEVFIAEPSRSRPEATASQARFCRETALLYRATPSITRAQRTSSEVSENQSFSNKHSLRSVAQRSCSLFSVKAPVSGGQCKQTSKHSTQGVFTAVFTSLYISSL